MVNLETVKKSVYGYFYTDNFTYNGFLKMISLKDKIHFKGKY